MVGGQGKVARTPLASGRKLGLSEHSNTMHISRLVIRNFRNFRHLDVPVKAGLTCIIGENNTGKTNLLHAIRLVLDANLSSQYRRLLDTDLHAGLTFSVPEQVVVSVELRDYEQQIDEFALVATAQVGDGVAALTLSAIAQGRTCGRRSRRASGIMAT